MYLLNNLSPSAASAMLYAYFLGQKNVCFIGKLFIF